MTAEPRPAGGGEDPARAGQAIYSRPLLAVYDAFVYGFNMPVGWRCSKRRLLDLYDANVSANHLDVGVGTGILLDECRFPAPAPRLTLLDMNPNSLAVTAARLGRYAPVVRRGNALEPWPVEPGSFDSVALTHIVHCLPGPMAAKAPVFDHAAAALAPGGTLFGATILGRGVKITAPGRALQALANARGALGNREDDAAGLDALLARRFPRREVRVRGAVALFVAAAT